MNEFPISIVCGQLNASPTSFDRLGIFWLSLKNKEKLQDLTGEVHSLSVKHFDKILKGKLFALSLSEINTSVDIKDKIVKKLVEI